jgi:hypothetical protein
MWDRCRRLCETTVIRLVRLLQRQSEFLLVMATQCSVRMWIYVISANTMYQECWHIKKVMTVWGSVGSLSRRRIQTFFNRSSQTMKCGVSCMTHKVKDNPPCGGSHTAKSHVLAWTFKKEGDDVSHFYNEQGLEDGGSIPPKWW